MGVDRFIENPFIENILSKVCSIEWFFYFFFLVFEISSRAALERTAGRGLITTELKNSK
jgi:hypothetical protein